MALRVTKWSPDTCGCVLHYEWDDAAPEDKRTHTAVAHPEDVHCAAHRHHAGDHHARHAAVQGENQGKNRAHARIIEKLPHLTREVEQGDGTTTRELHPAHPFTWSFDKNRKLTVKVAGATPAEVAAALADG